MHTKHPAKRIISYTDAICRVKLYQAKSTVICVADDLLSLGWRKYLFVDFDTV